MRRLSPVFGNALLYCHNRAGTKDLPHWTPDDIHWAQFDAARVDPRLLAIVKTAALVEANAADYVAYLRIVFADDAAFVADAEIWGAEERQHGDVLARWAALADPAFDFGAAMRVFQQGYRVPDSDGGSIRGSRAGELIARQVVETGTSSFYSALRDATAEPVLRNIAGRIAADEYRHYQLFAGHARRQPRLGRLRAIGIAIGRFAEIDDDELGWAWHAANIGTGPCDPQACSRRYGAETARLYGPGHIDNGVRMLLRAVGLAPRGAIFNMARLAMRATIHRRAAAA